MKCEYCQTVNAGSKNHPGTCDNCGALLPEISELRNYPYLQQQFPYQYYAQQQMMYTTTHQPRTNIYNNPSLGKHL